jgi:hypothetical protein
VRRLAAGLFAAMAIALMSAACSPPPMAPTPPGSGGGGGGGGGGGNNPPPNALPVVDSITIQGSRAKQPANFADANESVPVSAKVHDDETAADQLTYTWTATAGTFSGTGPNVTWIAPASVSAPGEVTITLTVNEKYGSSNQFEHSTTATATLSLHDSVKEVGTMARQFLLDFSDTNIKDADYIMRNFGTLTLCPEPNEVLSERDDVTRNFTEYRMVNFRIGPDTTTVNFGGRCPVFNNRGDACSTVPSMWDSIHIKDGARSFSDGNDIMSAIYSGSDRRWFLCASRYQVTKTIGAIRSIR